MSQELQRHLGISTGLAVFRAPVASCWLTALRLDKKHLNAVGGRWGQHTFRSPPGLGIVDKNKKPILSGMFGFTIRNQTHALCFLENVKILMMLLKLRGASFSGDICLFI